MPYFHATRRDRIPSILKHGLDKQPARAARQGELLPDHPNIRGSRYYH